MAAAALPYLISGVRPLDTAISIVLAAIGATGFGLVMGLAGQFSLGQALFMLVSGYTAALLTADRGWDPLVAMIVAVAASVVLGFLVGWITLRLRAQRRPGHPGLPPSCWWWPARPSPMGRWGQRGLAFSIFGDVVAQPRRFYYLSLGML